MKCTVCDNFIFKKTRKIKEFIWNNFILIVSYVFWTRNKVIKIIYFFLSFLQKNTFQRSIKIMDYNAPKLSNPVYIQDLFFSWTCYFKILHLGAAKDTFAARFSRFKRECPWVKTIKSSSSIITLCNSLHIIFHFLLWYCLL